MTPPTTNSRVCPMGFRSGCRVSARTFAGFSARMATICCQTRNRGVIHLDFQQDIADNPNNTPVAPLLELVPCHFSDVHQGRVSLCANTPFCSISDQNVVDITAAPPLVTNSQHAYLGRLIFCIPDHSGVQA